MTGRTATQKTTQTETLVQAKNWGETWTSADLDMLHACPEIPAAELALALGRTLYAVENARIALADIKRAVAAPKRVKAGQRWSSDLSIYEL